MSEIPEQLAYTKEHEWVAHDDVAIVGITAFAVEELGDIVFVELPSVGDTVTAGDACGEIESTKAVSEIYAPMSGEIVEVNDVLESSPETLGEDPYGDGWLFKLKTDEGEYALLDADGYRTLIE
jgi:glycine cleavage system H protein